MFRARFNVNNHEAKTVSCKEYLAAMAGRMSEALMFMRLITAPMTSTPLE